MNMLFKSINSIKDIKPNVYLKFTPSLYGKAYDGTIIKVLNIIDSLIYDSQIIIEFEVIKSNGLSFDKGDFIKGWNITKTCINKNGYLYSKGFHKKDNIPKWF